MAKLFLNSLSGKTIESLHLTNTIFTTSEAELLYYKKVDPDLKVISESQNYCIIRLSKDKISEIRKSKPIYIGCLIYSYARKHMYDSILRDFDVIYQDTDSAFLEESEYLRFVEERSHLIGD